MSAIRVILADDHVIVRNGIKILLESDGEVDVIAEASNGQEALEKAKELQPDILISDIKMPIMNGIEATARLKEVAPNTKALILSMHDDEEYIIKSVESGCFRLLTQIHYQRRIQQSSSCDFGWTKILQW